MITIVEKEALIQNQDRVVQDVRGHCLGHPVCGNGRAAQELQAATQAG